MQQSLRIHWWSKRREHRRTSIDDAMRESQCEASIDRSTSQKTEFTETIVDTIHREFGSHRPPGVPTPTASSLMFPSPPDFFTFLSFGVGWCRGRSASQFISAGDRFDRRVLGVFESRHVAGNGSRKRSLLCSGLRFDAPHYDLLDTPSKEIRNNREHSEKIKGSSYHRSN